MTNSPTISQLRELATDPPQKTQATTETIPYSIDMSRQLAAGQTVTSPSSKLVDSGPGTAVVPVDPPVVVGTSVQQKIRGGILTPGHMYYLIVTYAADANTELSAILTIYCPI